MHAGSKKSESECPRCFAAKIEQEALEHSRKISDFNKKHKDKSLVEMLGYSGIPKKFMKHGFQTFNCNDTESLKLFDVCKGYADNFGENLNNGRGLLMIGSPGRGKTHLASAICKTVIRNGFSALFVSTLGVIQIVKETYRPNSEMSERDAIIRFAKPDLLVLDEVGVQHKTKTEQVIITEIINRRYENEKATIMLSNLQVDGAGDSLMNVLGERVIDRLRETNDLLVFQGKSYRGRAA